MNKLISFHCLLLMVLTLFPKVASSQTFLYGITTEGGTTGGGTIYKIKPDGTSYSIVHNFNSDGYGKYPSFTEFIEYNSKLYSITPFSSGQGIIYEFNPSTGVLVKKLSTSGMYFNGTLTLFNGKMYGLSYYGGNSNHGSLFEYDPSTNVITIKVHFSGLNGRYPNGGLTIYNNKLYGITTEGGINGGTDGYGVLFEYDPTTNTFTKKFDFNGSNFIVRPTGSLTVFNSKFYGVVKDGGINQSGIIFEYDLSNGNMINKFAFNYATSGSLPLGNLTAYNNKIYGLLANSGSTNSGAIFEFDPANNTISNKFNFNATTHGSNLQGKLVLHNNKLYGMASQGGASSSGIGTLFEYTPSANTLVKKIDFDGLNNGSLPSGSLALLNDKFYAITSFGGLTNSGTLFEYNLLNNILTKKIDFNYLPNGYAPVGGLLLHNQKLYGTTMLGGSKDKGTLFEFDLINNSFAPKVSFDGITPNGDLTVYNNKIYGLTSDGGSFGGGILYEYDIASNVFAGKSNFYQHYPRGGLTVYNDKLYGLTNEGGIYSKGMLFEYNPSDGILSQKKHFDSSTGSLPFRNLTVANNKLYGMTSQEGVNSGGTIFEYNPLTDILTKKIDFNNTLGYNPRGNLTLYNGKLYGTTRAGGNSSGGTLFEYNPSNNSIIKKRDFVPGAGGNGGDNNGNFTIYNDKFYATSYYNGYGLGNFYRYDLSNNSISVLYNFYLTPDGNRPLGNLALVVKDINIVPSTPQVVCAEEQLNFNTIVNGFTPTSYNWNSSPANNAFISSASNPTFTTPLVSNQTIYTLTVTASNANGTASSTISVTINPKTIPTITPNNPTMCLNSSINLQSSVANSYQWYLNDSAIVSGGNTQSISVNQLGDYKVITTNSLGCLATSPTFAVTLTPNPNANFTFSTLQRTVTFTNSSSNSSLFSWNFGDNTTSSVVNPVKQYQNNDIYNVTLRSTNDCNVFQEITKQVSISYCDSNAFETRQSGNWNDVLTWDCGQIPNSTDIVIVKAGHTINIPVGYSAHVKNMIVAGRINYISGSQLIFGN
jgi:uncharacterized repeat protein (TIGR03803 family)